MERHILSTHLTPAPLKKLADKIQNKKMENKKNKLIYQRYGMTNLYFWFLRFQVSTVKPLPHFPFH